MPTFTLAHLSDVHLGPIAGFDPRFWNAKRLTGYINWRRTRRSAYMCGALDAIVTDLRAQAPDHVAVTGDLVNIGLPQEHINALAWLTSLGPPDHVTLVPGNHDIYSPIGRDPGTRRWAPYMAWNTAARPYGDKHPDFPFVRVLRRLALIGINSAVPTPPFLAWGRVGTKQMQNVGAILDRLRRDGLFRVVLIHHPPLTGQGSTTRGLRDAAAFQRVLTSHGAELVLHGHDHRSTLAWLRCATGRAAIVGVPSAALGRRHRHEPLARYHLYRIAENNPSTVLLVARGLAEPGGPVIELEKRELTLRDEGHEN